MQTTLNNDVPMKAKIHSVPGRRRKVAFSLLTFTLVATTVSGFTVPSSSIPNLLVSAAPSEPASPRSELPASTVDFFEPKTIQRPPILNFWNRRRKTTTNGASPQSRKRRLEAEDYDRRKQEWAALYTDVDALREHFGENKNKLWGDLDVATSRRLYKTLLPKALLELYKVGVKPEDLAPLAYQARIAAKLYARERSVVPARMAAVGYDGFRQWRKYGHFQPRGMTYDQVWEKYKASIMDEVDDDTEEEDVTARICLKILERSCQTNERIDKWVLGDERLKASEIKEQQNDLKTITEQLDRDVFEILKGHSRDALTARKMKTLRLLVRAKRRLEKLHDFIMEEPEASSKNNTTTPLRNNPSSTRHHP